MVLYECERCGIFKTEIKTHYLRHLRRKKSCKPLKKDITTDTLIWQINGNKYKTPADYCKTPADYCKTPADYCKTPADYCETTADYCETTADYCENTNLDEIPSNSSKDSVEIEFDHKNNLICQYCNKKFSRKENLENHLKKSCKMLKEFNNIYTYDEKTFGKSIYKDSNKAGDIYIIQTDYINEDHYKIGITTNIKKRMGNYRCGNTYEPRLHYYIACKDIKLIDNKIKLYLGKCRVKKEIFKGNVVDIKNKIVEVIKKEYKLDEVHVHEPGIKICNLTECYHCNKCFYNKNDLFDHFNSCENYREYLSKKKEGKYECKYCQKVFNRPYHMKRHENVCKHKKDSHDSSIQNEMFDFFKEQMAEMKEAHQKDKEAWAKEKNEMRHEIGNLLDRVGNVTNTINIKEQNIILNNYGHENLDYISRNYMNNLFKIPFGALPKLLTHIHFNPKHPENHNIKITNKKLPYASVWEGNKWTVKDKKQVIDHMVDKGYTLIDDQFTTEENELDEYQRKKYKNFRNQFDSQDKKLQKNLRKETEIMVLNNSKETERI
jgi:hypothetical protein